MPAARPAAADDLDSLLALFRASEVSAFAEPRERAERTWSDILSRDGVAVFVSDIDSRIVSTCMLITAPNLLHAGRQHEPANGVSRMALSDAQPNRRPGERVNADRST